MVSIEELNKINPDNPGLNARIYKYLDLFCKGEYEQCLDATYPPFFKKFPREIMLEKMKQAFENEDLIISTDLVTIDDIGKIIETDSGSYCSIHYTLLTAIQFRNERPVDEYEAERLESKKEFMINAFEDQYGKENIWFDDITKSYCFHLKSKMIALKDEFSPDWTFLTLADHPMIEEFVPKNVLIVLNAQR